MGDVRCFSIDVGTGNICSAERSETDKTKVQFRKVRDAFLKVDPNSYMGGNSPELAEKMLKKTNTLYIKIDGMIYVLGNSAYEMSIEENSPLLRPMKLGILNPNEPLSHIMVKELIRAVVGKPVNPETDIAFYCIPANPIDAAYDVDFHKRTLHDAIADLGYKNINVMNEALAVVYSELYNNNFTGIGLSFGSGMCLRGDTMIPLLDGTSKSLKELTDQYKVDKKPFWVYSCKEDGTIVAGKAWNPHKVKKAKLLRLWLDNGQYIDSTVDHKMMMRDGSYTEAQNLKVGDSMMPFYMHDVKIDNRRGYKTVKNNKTNRFNHVHRIIYKTHFGKDLTKDDIIHHINCNPSDNRPENLQLTNRSEHQMIHENLSKWIKKNLKGKSYEDAFGKEKSDDIRQKQREAHTREGYENTGMFIKGQTPVNKGKTLEEMHGKRKAKKIRKLISEETSKAQKGITRTARETRICRCGCGQTKEVKVTSKWKYVNFSHFVNHNGHPNKGRILTPEERLAVSVATKKAMRTPEVRKNFEEGMKRKLSKYHNHKIVKIEHLDIAEDVYDMTVDEYHNFAVSSGIFVHNCNFSYANRGKEILSFSVSKGGDYIDEKAALQVNDTIPIMTYRKEDGMDLLNPKDSYEKAIQTYYYNLIEYFVDCFCHLYETKDKKTLPRLFKEIPMVVAGGTSMIKGFIPVLRETIEKKKNFPIALSEIRLAEEPMYAVASGLWQAAKLKAEL